MTWQTITIQRSEIRAVVGRIRRDGGIITRCCLDGEKCVLTFCSRNR